MGDHSPLADEATSILTGYEARFEEAVETVRSLEEERKEVIEARDAALERERRAYDNWRAWRVASGDTSRQEKEAERESRAADREASSADRYLASGELDTEYRKAVARQMAGLLRDDARRKLEGMKVCTTNPEVLKTITECDGGVLRAAHYVIKMFPPASELHNGEVNKARAEALERLGYSD